MKQQLITLLMAGCTLTGCNMPATVRVSDTLAVTSTPSPVVTVSKQPSPTALPTQVTGVTAPITSAVSSTTTPSLKRTSSTDSDRATVTGTVLFNGIPVDYEEISLVAIDESDELTTTTTSNGAFIFEDVTPGTYYLMILVFVLKGGECNTPSESFDLVYVTTSGAPVDMAMVSNSNTPFEVRADDHVLKRIAFQCSSSRMPKAELLKGP